MKFSVLLFSALIVAAVGSARAQTLTADLSSHVIGITTGFAGDNLVLFGSTDRPGDIIVTVRGPPTAMVVRRKERVFGLWLNGSSVTFRDAPSFYALASTRPLSEIASVETLNRYQLDLNDLKLQPSTPADNQKVAAFREAFLSHQEEADLYHRTPSRVIFLGERLFRADMNFPANVPTGNYSVEVRLMAGGQVVSEQTTVLVVSRIGFSNGVYAVAQHQAALYGLATLMFAIAAGWAASAIFRKV